MRVDDMERRDRLSHTTYRRSSPQYSALRKRAQLTWLTMRMTAAPKLMHAIVIICILFFICASSFFFGRTPAKPSHKHDTDIDVEILSSNVMFVIDSKRQAIAWQPLICRIAFWEDVSVRVLISGAKRDASKEEIDSIIRKKGCSVKLYDMHIDDGNSYSWSEENKIDVMMQTSQVVGKIMKKANPAVVFITKDDDNYVMRGVSAALSGFDRATTIAIPLPDVKHSLWIADLSLSILQHWKRPRIQLQVITQNRFNSFSRLMQSLSSAFYFGDEVSLTISMDRKVDQETMDFCRKFKWQYGSFSLRDRVVQGGLLVAVMESYYPADNHEYGIPLEDDVEVSPFFYMWAKYALLKYRYGPGRSSSRRLYGISLYGPKTSELHWNGRRPFDPEAVLQHTSYPTRSPYLFQVPCSWGAVYFPEVWREFHQYLKYRMDDVNGYNVQNITVPGSRSVRWRNSWKRFFIELVYLRGYVMLYPNFKNFTSLSTNHAESGEHMHPERKKTPPSLVFTVPLMNTNTVLEELPNGHLPQYAELPVLDLWGNVVGHDELIHRGLNLQREVSECPPEDLTYDPKDLLCAAAYQRPTPTESLPVKDIIEEIIPEADDDVDTLVTTAIDDHPVELEVDDANADDQVDAMDHLDIDQLIDTNEEPEEVPFFLGE
ncbi:10930_t:CDS:2 [Paraglomus occultum]|uniref:10930_t:CDS:1 n=1 Tax=Paraglomus occultum TaxID=144539 RepID=A0A9N9FG70_9GLOM|nr:10930_t:CDS:2 [Paraglomus occultum]